MSETPILNERARIEHLAATCACNNLRRAARAVTNYYDTIMIQAVDLRSTQVTMLVVLQLAGPQTINEMAEQLGVDRTTLTRNLKPLEQRELLATAPGTDQRTRVVSLTSAGAQVLLKALPFWEQAQAHVIAGIGIKRFERLLDQLSTTVALVNGSD